MDLQDQEVEATAAIWFYSFAETGWYSPEYNFVIPDDAVEVPEPLMLELKSGLAEGRVLVMGGDGMPALADKPPPTAETLAEVERRWRDRQLLATDPLVTRHRDELELEQATTLTVDQYRALQQYRAALRAWPEFGGFPLTDERPAPPDWLADSTQ